MKKILLLLVSTFLFGINVNAQKITENKVDKFTKKQIVQTSFEKIASDKNMLGSAGGRIMKNIWISFRRVNEKNYLRLKWCTNDVLALSENADVIFLDDGGNTYTFKNTDFTVSGRGEGTIGIFGADLYGLNIYLEGDCAALKGKNITDMRINTTDGYMDFTLNKKASKKLSATYEVFEKAIKK